MRSWQIEDAVLQRGDALGRNYAVVHLREVGAEWASYLVRRREDGVLRHALVFAPELSASVDPARVIEAFASSSLLAAPAHVRVEYADVHADTCYVVFSDDLVYVSLRRIVDAETFWPTLECLSACQMLALSLAAAWEGGRLSHARLSPDTVCVDPTGSLRLLDLGLRQFRLRGDRGGDPVRQDMRAFASLIVFMLTGVEAPSDRDVESVCPYLPPSVASLTRQLVLPLEQGGAVSWEPIICRLSHILSSSEYCMSRGIGVLV